MFSVQEVFPVLLAGVLFAASCFIPSSGWPKIFGFALSALIAAVPSLQSLADKILDRKIPGEELLILIAVILVFVLKEYSAAAMAMIPLINGRNAISGDVVLKPSFKDITMFTIP